MALAGSGPQIVKDQGRDIIWKLMATSVFRQIPNQRLQKVSAG